jgi:hypothetical protein
VLKTTKPLLHFMCALFGVTTVLEGCNNQEIQRTNDWWQTASDQQIADIVYQSFCTPNSSTCLQKHLYKFEISRRVDRDFAIGFLSKYDKKDTAISCTNYRRNMELLCYGTGRRGGRNCGYVYPIIWEKGQVAPAPKSAC